MNAIKSGGSLIMHPIRFKSDREINAIEFKRALQPSNLLDQLVLFLWRIFSDYSYKGYVAQFSIGKVQSMDWMLACLWAFGVLFGVGCVELWTSPLLVPMLLALGFTAFIGMALTYALGTSDSGFGQLLAGLMLGVANLLLVMVIWMNPVDWLGMIKYWLGVDLSALKEILSDSFPVIYAPLLVTISGILGGFILSSARITNPRAFLPPLGILAFCVAALPIVQNVESLVIINILWWLACLLAYFMVSAPHVLLRGLGLVVMAWYLPNAFALASTASTPLAGMISALLVK
jgi:hypothetical protein